MSQSKKKPGGAKKDRGAPATPPQEEVAPNSKKKDKAPAPSPRLSRPSSLLDTRVIYCGDNLEQLAKLPPACVDLIYIDPPFNSNRNYEVFWGETKEKRSFEDRHASTQAYIDYMRPRCQQLARVLKKKRIVPLLPAPTREPQVHWISSRREELTYGRSD